MTTHDLPPTAGYLAGDHVELRDRLGLLTRPVAEELEVDEADRDAWLNALRERHLLGNADGDVERIVEALHRYVAHTPAKLVGVALTDAVGERRTQNQPGTTDEYPNWRVPLGGPDGDAGADRGPAQQHPAPPTDRRSCDNLAFRKRRLTSC